MSVAFSYLIKKCLQLNEVILSDIESIILENDFTPLSFCQNCITMFMDLNFTGPVNSEIESNVAVDKKLLSKIHEDLTCEGEVPFLKAKGIILLWIVKQLSSKMIRSSLNSLTRYKFCVIFFQCIYIHKSTLRDHVSAFLSNELDECLKIVDELKNDDITDYASEFQLSLLGSYLALSYYKYDLSEKLFNRCKELLGIETSFNGAIGKRTKFQTTEVSQLYLEVVREPIDSARIINDSYESSGTLNLPNDVMMDDELLLDEIAYKDLGPVKKCTVAEQALLMLQCERHLRSHGKDEHVVEECDAIVFAAIGSGRGRVSLWSIVTEALLYRSRFIGKSSRKIDRSIRQLEQLSVQFNHVIPINDEPRSEWFFLSRDCAVWELDTIYGEMLLQLGDIRSALDVLQRWDHWKAIIECHTRLGQRGRAETAIRSRLAEDGDSAELLCCLGDVTQDRTQYERAWEVSKRRSARAMRSLAMHYMFVDRDHAMAAECFEKSLAQNVMQINTWFTYGHCCVQLQQYRKAVAAFKQCFTYEPDNYEAWCNCASALVELGEPQNALTFLKEAVKYSYENWKVWDNICIVSASAGDYATTIKAYHRVIDLKNQHRDPSSLAKIVRAISVGDSEQFRAKLKELFARIAAVDGRDPRLFMLQAELLESDPDQSQVMRERIVTCLSKSYHCMSQQQGWERVTTSCKRVMASALRLVDRSVEFGVNRSQARLAVKSVLSVVRTRQSEELEPMDDELMRLLCQLEEADELLQAN